MKIFLSDASRTPLIETLNEYIMLVNLKKHTFKNGDKSSWQKFLRDLEDQDKIPVHGTKMMF